MEKEAYLCRGMGFLTLGAQNEVTTSTPCVGPGSVKLAAAKNEQNSHSLGR